MTADTVVDIWAPILTGRSRGRLQLGERSQLDPDSPESLADRRRDLRRVGRVPVDADAPGLERQLAALDRPHRAFLDETHSATCHLGRVPDLLHALEDELPGR